jgi:G6PDH family F420-dependent oxidoreductase
MTTFGYTLMGEEHDPRDLVAAGRRAEEVGFDFLVASDHYHPWVPQQEHSPYVWSVLGAVAATTEHVGLATFVTCPIMRYHPAVVAQKAATVGLLADGRFTLGLGAGELLNEHVVGQGWPPVDVRHEMLVEAIEVCRSLWRGGYQSFRGEYFTVEDARVFDLPDRPVPIAVAAGGPQAAQLAAEFGDQLISDRPAPEVVDAYRNAGGDGPTWTQIAVCWGEDASKALQLARDRFRFSALGWKVMSELPNPVNFDAATETVAPEHLAGSIPAGPDADRYVDAVRTASDAGFDRVAFVQIGDDQEGWFRFWAEELARRLGASTHEPAAAGA